MGPHNHLKSKSSLHGAATIRVAGSRQSGSAGADRARITPGCRSEQELSACNQRAIPSLRRACVRARSHDAVHAMCSDPCAAAVGLPLQLATNGLRAVSPVQLEAFRLEPLRSDHRLERPVLPQLLVLLVGQPARHLHASRTVAWVWRAVPCTANARRHAVCSRVLKAGGARGAWKADQSGTPSLIARNFCS